MTGKLTFVFYHDYTHDTGMLDYNISSKNDPIMFFLV